MVVVEKLRRSSFHNYYWNIPISTDNLIRVHNILAGITLFVVLVLYVKSNKIIIRKNNK